MPDQKTNESAKSLLSRWMLRHKYIDDNFQTVGQVLFGTIFDLTELKALPVDLHLSVFTPDKDQGPIIFVSNQIACLI
ncbi:hypothetical protein AJ79_01814 [Helicocarpus griseus UAMH5409]|uniref:Uncharacterized protein n=1 Tax=Helicocarpus griseus UAMH5409 TaxID=1447875 RepID=A0A2B7Y4Z0_9EURO|nr:hypothetical protein AJ79_01814 [Helicocarpus griseus UAMH5409]